MKSKREVIKKWEYHIYGLLILVFIQCISIPLLNAFIKEFVKQANIRNMLLAIVITGCLLIDVYFLINRIIILRCLLNKQPIKCILDDIIFIAYKDDKKTRYAPFFIVRSIVDQKQYLTYDKYSLLNYTTTFDYSNRGTVSYDIYKSDGTSLKLGEEVDMYIQKTINVTVSIDYSKNIVKLNHRKIHFRHMNNRISIDVFKNISFFKGAIDINVNV